MIDRSILATVEYGAEHLHIPLLVVMGHESCGAVKAAAESKSAAPSPSLDYLLKAIQAARKPATQERDEIKTLVLANVEQVINDAIGMGTLLQHLVDGGRLGVVGAYYELRCAGPRSAWSFTGPARPTTTSRSSGRRRFSLSRKTASPRPYRPAGERRPRRGRAPAFHREPTSIAT